MLNKLDGGVTRMKTKYNWMEEARTVASHCYGDVQSVTKELALWMKTASEHQTNTEYYRDLLEKCGKSIGESAYVCDDGTKSESVLCAKIPELVEGLLNQSDDVKTSSLDFSEALKCVKLGFRVCRSGWNGKDMWICLTKGSVIKNKDARSGAVLAAANSGSYKITINDHIDMKTADGSICCGWLASQMDMLANDWMVVKD